MTTPSYISGLLFTKAHKLVRARIYDILEVYSLNPTLWSVLSAARRADSGIRQSIVAQQLGVKPPMVTMLADDLISLGLVKRLAHHSDGRVKLLVATPKGLKLANELETKLDREIHALMAGLSPAEIMIFQKTLETIITNAE
jgi:DNA-binding MarR family transcriptional regulator